MPSGNISFGGVVDPQWLTATRTIGTRPDRAVLHMRPQPGSPDCSGTATLSFNFNGTSVIWRNALCDRGTLQFTTHGFVQVCEILDRRWSWSKSYFTKAYNVRQADGTIIAATQATLAQIATALFTKLGVTADVTAIVTTELTQIIFDRHRVDDALDMLLTQRGYVISLMPDDTVKVFVRGVGVALPNNGDVRTVNFSLNPPEIPQWLTVCGRRTLVQSKLYMIPVGIDLDGKLKYAINLSYAPTGGWAGCDFETFNFITNPDAQELCKLCIGKWYQVLSQADFTQNVAAGGVNYIPGEVGVSTVEQILPLEPKLLTCAVDVFGLKRPDIPFVEGTFYEGVREAQPPMGQNTADFTRVDKREWTFDKELGIVKFKELALRADPGPTPVGSLWNFATVFLTCAYSVDDPNSRVKDRYTKSRNLGGIGEDLYKVDELERQLICSYSAGSGTIASIEDNQSSVDIEATAFLNAAQNNYTVNQANVIGYRGIYAFNTDGVNLQIRWDAAAPGECPWGTMVAQNAEGLPLLPTTKERNLQRRTRMTSNPINRRNQQWHKGKRKLGR